MIGSFVRYYGHHIFTVRCCEARNFSVNCYMRNYNELLQCILDTR